MFLVAPHDSLVSEIKEVNTKFDADIQNLSVRTSQMFISA